jgi:hypothetical protein
MLKSDIQNTIDVTDNPDQVILYDVAAQYNKITTPEIINKILIEENKAYINKTLVDDSIADTNVAEGDKLDEAKANAMIDGVYTNLIAVINNTINPDVKAALTGLAIFLEELIKPMNSYDFFDVKKSTGISYLEFMNNSKYINGSLVGYLSIESEFDDKLRKIISVSTKAKEGFITKTESKMGGK